MITLSDWKPYTVRGTLAKTALIRCMICRRDLVLCNYEIDDTGIVTPKVTCPHCKRPLGDIRLQGWPFEIDITS